MASKGYMLHLGMHGYNLLGEITELRKQFKNKKLKVLYYSKFFEYIQLFVEFMFEILNEKDEPLVLTLETIKAIFKIKEYY